jgi:hypothetical protein
MRVSAPASGNNNNGVEVFRTNFDVAASTVLTLRLSDFSDDPYDDVRWLGSARFQV